jgi:hypothetical protein
MHMGMRMSFVGGGMRKTVRGGRNGNDRTRNGSREHEWFLWGGGMRKIEHGMAAKNGNELCGEGGMRMTEHGMAAYPLPP